MLILVYPATIEYLSREADEYSFITKHRLLQLIMSTSLYTVMDSVNKYRHGVLVGNFVQDKFGNDLNAKGPVPDAPKITTTGTLHNLRSSLHQPNQFLNNQTANNSQFYSTAKTVSGQPYKRPEASSTYNIFHQQEVNHKVPLIPNNPKLQEKQEAEGRAYDITRQQLANKFTRPQTQDPSLQNLSEEIPDILTGEIVKAKTNLGSQQYFDQKGKTKIDSCIKPKSINPYGTYSVVKPQIQKFQDVQYNKFVYPHHKGEKRDVLFGHGLALEDFQKRQLTTTYDLSFNQQVPPQTQVNSFYEPDHNSSAREFHKTSLYEKNHQSNIPAYGEKKILGQAKEGRPYQPFTGTFDYTHLKNQYLRSK